MRLFEYFIHSSNKLYHKVILSPIAWKKIKNHIRTNTYSKLIKLNLGCGTDYKVGWINIDKNSDKIDLKWDVKYELPFHDNSVDFVFNEHLLEHLTVYEALSLLKEVNRILKIGGVLRIAVPDLRLSMLNYFNPQWKSESWINQYGFQNIITPAEYINIIFREWGHKYMYDNNELIRRLNEAGFSKISNCNINISTYNELRFLETRMESTLIVEAIK